METEKELEELEQQADKSAVALQKIGATGEKLKSVGSSIEGAGKKLMPVTAAVGGLGAAAVKIASDFDSDMSKVAAVSGTTGTELDKQREKAREMGAKTKFSVSEAAEAMNYMAMAGWKTGDMLDGIEGVMNLAAASGALGFSAADTAEAIGLMANAGIKSSQAGTAMRTMLTSLTGDVTFVGDSFGELTVQTVKTDGSMRSLGDIMTDCRAEYDKNGDYHNSYSDSDGVYYGMECH